MSANSPIDRAGKVHFGDASLCITEEGIAKARNAGLEDAWCRQFKRQVFARVIQQLNRLGWSVGPWDQADQYAPIALNFRTCAKGDLQAELSMCGRTIELKIWQDVQNVENPNGGRHDFDKERGMTYLQRLEMERTRGRIRTYLCNIFADYRFVATRPARGPAGVTALEWMLAEVRQCWHYRPELDRRGGEDASYNHRSAEGAVVRHGAPVWFADRKGRLLAGTAYYNINSMWWVITGRYDLHNVSCSALFTCKPENLRIKRNAALRQKRLADELKKASESMDFERAIVLRNILYPKAHAERKAA